MDFDEWKVELAAALERECWWEAGEGLHYIEDAAEDECRKLFEKGVPPSIAAFEVYASIATRAFG